MKLIVGLGNPGKKYEKTRHNIGFRVVDEIIKSQKVLLLKPQTYMNESGKAVKSLTTKYKLQTTDIVVVHDDVDLPFGTIRLSKDSSSAGHKGVQSIIDELETKDFTRIRIGINPTKPAASFASGRARQNENLLAGFVLKNFTKDEEKQLPEIIKKAVEKIKLLFDSCS